MPGRDRCLAIRSYRSPGRVKSARECTFLLVARPRGARGSDVAPLGEKSIGCIRLCRTGSAPSRHATASPQRERTTPSPKSEIVFNPIFWSKGELLSIP
jgi:hypothetical protein